jgi:hypothetical protein
MRPLWVKVCLLQLAPNVRLSPNERTNEGRRCFWATPKVRFPHCQNGILTFRSMGNFAFISGSAYVNSSRLRKAGGVSTI